MKKILLTPLFFILAISLSQAQNALAPEYLTKQEFPDSVKNSMLQRLNGETISFVNAMELYKGKKVVIDIWASWCRDCIVGLPQLEELKQKTADFNTIYIFISVDKDETKWRTAITRFNIQGEHYRIETGWSGPLTNYLQLDWVPRYCALNEKGQIIMPKAVKADNEELLMLLTK